VAGRIRDEDVALVRERARIDEVVGEHVQLRSAGGGSLKGLCPFHDEKSPSFSVTPSRGLYYCFGCTAGGDVIDFLRGIEHLTFAEAVERLADRYGVQLRYVEGTAAVGRDRAPKTRSVEANRAARDYFVEQLATSAEAEIGRAFLAGRGFDGEAIARFGVGYAPNSWDALTQHLRAKGFAAEEMLAAGLLSQGQRGTYDRFRGRLVWPIRSVSGDVVGFGARRLREDDDGPKYLNTPETSLYHKSEILYGIDLAKREIAKQRRVVVVEGYTDVMACHLAGVETAVATCGTSFGEDHVRVLRRLLMDSNELRGEVIFTFDGDEAGRKAAVRSFTEDRRFVTQLFVAVQPDGLDPCELWQQHGAQALQDLVASRTPLAEFVIRSVLAGYDLDTPAGRIGALRAAAPLAAHTKDHSMRGENVRSLAGWLGMEIEPVRAEVQAAARAAARTAPDAGRPGPGGSGSGTPGQVGQAGFVGIDTRRPSAADASLSLDREVLKIALQRPQALAVAFDRLPPAAFAHPAYAAVAQAITDAGGIAGANEDAGGTAEEGAGWVSRVRSAAANDAVRSVVTELAVEPLRNPDDVDNRSATMMLASVQERLMQGEIAELRSRLQRLDPGSDDYTKLFTELVELERNRQDLHQQATGG
jgi:DNA primase